jgi:hypothetical protein
MALFFNILLANNAYEVNLHNSIAMLSLKKSNTLARILTRIFFSKGGCDDYCTKIEIFKKGIMISKIF